jgi:hypothetical protein
MGIIDGRQRQGFPGKCFLEGVEMHLSLAVGGQEGITTLSIKVQ